MLTPGTLVRDWDGSTLLQPGEYAKHPTTGHWMACTPNGMLADLRRHSWIQHDDGTISVAPSILVTQIHARGRWHGYLEAGTWRQVD